ncbi:hypothetical protein EMIHUDRAFT_226719 [Emiliania huxleyi CCMP1516]|uniref:Photolyase/cryptochrome alpha/beta domain-containing protein n=2 Tax=Emiliania huxleyi TaxID=2903 RepID=A0A0D3KK61_EMIH1|nr:hypothetical protein EMIHUDRAFT_226719 [Emiliania huxleyi CCMP1516]EOD36146.1 hypothetical protein EMIHUDRAFT_226719 [Emiliania huxleyi CCMP1516]|eukprot:XP_005788575.1 hypothetical protein EMIHUDRAFT_226719 [Emiliania huxleyi CCMP1516]
MSEPAPTAALDSLPSALRERIRGEPSAQQQPCAPPPRTRIATTAPAHVLYLVRTALRAERNPALEVALRIASAQGIPLVCVAVVEDSHPPAVPRLRRPPTDRSAAFRLEALSELQPAFEKRGTALWVHLVRDGCRAAVAMSLAARAALVVAEEHFGASRMSAYVNSGMIDPATMARDAASARADKFLDEFVGWREAPYVWCLRHPGGYARAAVAVPAWGRNQLAGCGGGGEGPSLAELESGRTGDAYWDDCQRCLALSGELHNNVRMAWGKAVPAWWEAAAGELLIHLNDSFALDGGAPPSYGGLLWCLGWRDKPGPGGAPAPESPTQSPSPPPTAPCLRR